MSRPATWWAPAGSASRPVGLRLGQLVAVVRGAAMAACSASSGPSVLTATAHQPGCWITAVPALNLGSRATTTTIGVGWSLSSRR
ncbi:hypothetical protein GKC29_14805 [Micromonospora sp. WMMC415]|uniref:hypothetical protein n=1 Tax=Micromonospora sp. WMMC415 TaxID=2675222 RepID=UPI0012B4BE08|nr:hypothetical protein [Micromonospora sp. WMMC415]QGN47988.1 hypothetical protein GKC29_14805 [Micromonospora sp. WMMC415]